jgi:hypothetical protein
MSRVPGDRGLSRGATTIAREGARGDGRPDSRTALAAIVRARLDHHPRTRAAWLALGIIGLLFCILGFVSSPQQAYMSYLTAYCAMLGVVLGALIMVMTAHATNASWFVVLRRLAEDASATIPLFALLFIPILVGMRELYPWVTPDALGPDARERVLAKQGYLNVPFFVIRAIVYFACWTALAWLLRRWSVRQDRERDNLELSARQRHLSAFGLVIVGVTLTFASFDWLMSLLPTWYSTVFGVYIFAGAFVGALALVAIVGLNAVRGGALTGLVHADHFHALGKLMLTMVIFWAYIAFAQLLIIWIGDIPEEIAWYYVRWRNGWGALGLVLLFGNFVLPFLLLLSRDFKRSPRLLAALGAWLLVMHYVDIYWVAVPALHREGFHASWFDLASLAAVIGLPVALWMYLVRARAAVPVGDPYLDASLRYETEDVAG